MLHKITEVVVFATMTIASIALWFTADALPVSKRYAQVDSDLWPKLVLGALAICCTIQLAKKLVEMRAPSSGAFLAGYMPIAYYLRLGLTAALIVAYFISLQYIGFLLATVLFLWAGAWIMPYRNTAVKLAFAPAFTLLLTAFFSYGLELSLPRGAGIFYDLSQALY